MEKPASVAPTTEESEETPSAQSSEADETASANVAKAEPAPQQVTKPEVVAPKPSNPAPTPAAHASANDASDADYQRQERIFAEIRAARLRAAAPKVERTSSAVLAPSYDETPLSLPKLAPPPTPDPYGDTSVTASRTTESPALTDSPSKADADANTDASAPSAVCPTCNVPAPPESPPNRAPRVGGRRTNKNLLGVLQNSDFSNVFETESLFTSENITVYGGFDLMFVQPSFENTDALRTQTGAGTAFTTDFDYNFEATPRIVGGLVFENGFGARAQFWQFDHAVSAASGPSVGTLAISAPGVLPIMSSLVTDAAGQSLTAEHSLQLDVFDLEGTRQLRVGATAVTLGGGVRYLHMEQRYDVQKLDAAGTLLGSLSHDHDFEGFGPTFAAEWFTPLGDSGLAFYASGRGSVVFGTRDQTATRLDPGNAIPIVREDRLDQNAQVAVGEAGIGLQYALDSLIFRVGYEAQIWTDVGSATSASGNMGLQGIFGSLGFSF